MRTKYCPWPLNSVQSSYQVHKINQDLLVPVSRFPCQLCQLKQLIHYWFDSQWVPVNSVVAPLSVIVCPSFVFSSLLIIASPCLVMVLYMYITSMLCSIAHPCVVRCLAYHHNLKPMCGVVYVYRNYNVVDSIPIYNKGQYCAMVFNLYR